MNYMFKYNRKQSESIFRDLVREHSEKIYNLALMKSSQRALAEDICQETFIRVYKGLPNFRDDASIGTWIYRIALNVCHSMLKKESGIQNHEVPIDEDNYSELTDEDSDVQNIHDAMNQKETIRQAIASLPQQQADVITLYYLKEFQYSEVAEIMNIPLNTVKSHLRRAKENLRQMIPMEAV